MSNAATTSRGIACGAGRPQDHRRGGTGLRPAANRNQRLAEPRGQRKGGAFLAGLCADLADIPAQSAEQRGPEHHAERVRMPRPKPFVEVVILAVKSQELGQPVDRRGTVVLSDIAAELEIRRGDDSLFQHPVDLGIALELHHRRIGVRQPTPKQNDEESLSHFASSVLDQK